MRHVTLLITFLVVLGLAGAAHGTVIVGVDSTAAANWRTNAQLDVLGGSEYGTDGYIVYGINDANGQYRAPYAFNFDQVSLPGFITGITEPAGTNMWSGNGNFGTMEDPGNGNAITNTPLLSFPGGDPRTYTIQRTAGADFRLTILVASGDGQNVTFTTSVTDSVDTETQALGHSANGLHYHVYDVEAGTGNVTVTIAANSNYQATGFAFDVVPEPSAFLLAATGLLAMLALGRRRK